MKVHRFGSKSHNWYVIEDAGKATVIDLGCSGEYRVLLSGLARLGMTLADVEVALLTHGHPDHAGSAKQVIDDGGDVRVHTDDVARMLGSFVGKEQISAREIPPLNVRAYQFMVPLLLRGVLRFPRPTTIATFEDGDVVDAPGRPKVIHTPGHTDGHSAFYVTNEGMLFSGDALVTMSAFGVREGPQVLPDGFHQDPGLAKESLGRFSDTPTRVVYPGHGEPFLGDLSAVIGDVA